MHKPLSRRIYSILLNWLSKHNKVGYRECLREFTREHPRVSYVGEIKSLISFLDQFPFRPHVNGSIFNETGVKRPIKRDVDTSIKGIVVLLSNFSGHPLLKGICLDLIFMQERTFASGMDAANAYLLAAQVHTEASEKSYCAFAASRAAQISGRFGPKNPHYKGIFEFNDTYILSLSAVQYGFSIIRPLEQFVKLNHITHDLVLDYCNSELVLALAADKFAIARGLLELKLMCEQDESKRNDIIIEIAASWELEAADFAKNGVLPNEINCIEEAIRCYRNTSKNAKVRILTKVLKRKNKLLLPLMHKIEHSYDISDLINEYKGYVKSGDFEGALDKFFDKSDFTHASKLLKSLAGKHEGTLTQLLFGNETLYGHDMMPAYRSSPEKGVSVSVSRQFVLLLEMAFSAFYKCIWAPFYATGMMNIGSLSNSLIGIGYKIDREDDVIYKLSEFLAYDMRYEFVLAYATNLEGFLRNFCERKGLVSGTLTPQDIFDRWTLGGLVERRVGEKATGPDFYILIDFIFSSRSGLNIRNLVAHGIASPSLIVSSFFPACLFMSFYVSRVLRRA